MGSDLRPKSERAAPCAVVAALLAALAGLPAARGAASAVPARPDDRTIVHVLNRTGFGPRPGDIARVREIGLDAWIDRQLRPERISDAAVEARLSRYETLDLSSREIARQYFEPARQARRARKSSSRSDASSQSEPPSRSDPSSRSEPEILRARQVLVELSAQKIIRAVYSERQLGEVLTDFWFNHFNVYAGKGLTRVFVTEYEREAVRPHVLGRFRDLLGATAKSPAMLFFLDNARSTRAGINENYARELMELHTLGVDGGYTQQDVVNVARAFTGWTIAGPRRREAGGFVFNPRTHDTGEKIVLGHRIKAGGGIEDGEQVLDILASHPSTARFIATALARRFVADTPPVSLVDRVSAVFRETGGDLRAVTRAILTSPEFFAPDVYRAKVKTPLEFLVSALRATGADIERPQPLERTLRELGMPLYFCQPPTGYKDTADAWVNTGALINRMNFAVAVASNTFRGVVVSNPLPDRDRPDAETAVDVFLNGDATDTTRATIQRATTAAQVVALSIGSPEFQRR